MLFWVLLCCHHDSVENTSEGEAMACARVPLDEQQVTEPGPLGKEHTLPALVSQLCSCCYANISLVCTANNNTSLCSSSLLSASTSAPRQEGGAMFCALQASARGRLSCWGGGVFGICQVHFRGPGLAACTASWQVLVPGEGLSACLHLPEPQFHLFLFSHCSLLKPGICKVLHQSEESVVDE